MGWCVRLGYAMWEAKHYEQPCTEKVVSTLVEYGEKFEQ